VKFTDLYIRRPVLASVISLFILLLGFNSLSQLSIREYPEIEIAIVTVQTRYIGANQELIQGFITTPIQQAISSAEGISYITSSSSNGMSTIVANIQPGYSTDAVLTEIMAKSAEVRGELPPEAEDPVITKGNAGGNALMYLRFKNPNMSVAQLTDYVVRVVQPQLITLEGVGGADIFGGRFFAMRIWLDPTRMVAFDVTAPEIANALRQNNFQSSSGETRSEMLVTQVNAETDLTTVEEFGNIVIRSVDNTLVRIKDVATVELDAESYNSKAYGTGELTVVVPIFIAPGANPLDVADLVKKELVVISEQGPEGFVAGVASDGSAFIKASLDEVVTTLAEASLIVIIVVFLFLGQIRSVIIPVVAIPLSLIGTLFLIWLLGYSINLLTLLALVLAIGLVVDDAIVVVENIHRHIEEGLSSLEAALQGAREISMPVISMTITLAAVYAPLGFLGGVTGTLFKEFAFTLAGAVVISGVVALTLSPMMCSKLLVHTGDSGFARRVDDTFEKLMAKYRAGLKSAIQFRPVFLTLAVIIFLTIPFLLWFSQSELAPNEDDGILFMITQAPEYASLQYVEQYTKHYEGIYNGFEEYDNSFLLNSGSNAGATFGGMLLSPWDKRERTIMEIQPLLQQKLDEISGVRAFVLINPPLPGSGRGMPVELIVKSVSDYRQLAEISERLAQEARDSGLFVFASSDLKFSKPELNVAIDRDKASELGVSMEEVGNTLGVLLGEGWVNRFSIEGRSYKVIPQSNSETRTDGSWLNRFYVRTRSGEQIPLSSLITITTVNKPPSFNQFQQLNSAKIQAMPRPGVSLGDALEHMQQIADQMLPSGYLLDFDGQSRQYFEEGNQLYYIFLVSLIAIYLVLAAQFESFRDPFIILISVPLSICGALIPIALGFATLNIYSQIGLITLIGLISKHGILIVEFANQLQRQGHSIIDAITEAATVRLRPVLMTTAAMVLGILPLVFASGAGAVSRNHMGIVIVAGMLVGTMFTLYIVPVMYTLLARDHTEELGVEATPGKPTEVGA